MLMIADEQQKARSARRIPSSYIHRRLQPISGYYYDYIHYDCKQNTMCVYWDFYDALTALRFVHAMYGSRRRSEFEFLVRALRRASGAFMLAVRSCHRYVRFRHAKRECLLTAVRRRIPGAMCAHHFARVFFSASSLTPFGFNQATNSSTCRTKSARSATGMNTTTDLFQLIVHSPLSDAEHTLFTLLCSSSEIDVLLTPL